MSDLIRRRAGYTFGNDEFSLEAAYHDCKLVFDGITDDASFQEADTGLILYYANEIIYALHEALEGKDTNVPSSDTISRQAAIDGLDGHYVERRTLNDWQVGWNAALDWVGGTYLDELPSAQPETHGKRTETHSCDLIDRRAAIDALHMHLMYRMGTDSNKKRLDEWINSLPSAQPKPKWIPCSERLPEDSGRYLISVLDGVGRRTTVAPYQPRYKAWTMTGRMAYWKVIAWMPLPEPYQAERRTDEPD